MGRLVISRNVGDAILIGDDIEVQFSGLKGSQVRVCVTAPDTVAIRRKEVPEGVYTAPAASPPRDDAK